MSKLMPFVSFRNVLPIGIALATITNFIYYKYSWYQGPIGDFYSPYHLTSLSEEFTNNAYKNKAYSSVLKKQSKEVYLKADDNGKVDETIAKLKDYTLKIQLPCSSGTAWILDYVKKDDEEYPKKWFIATNAHVINSFRFTSNKYDQVLPISLSETQHLRNTYGNRDGELSPIAGEACAEAKYHGYSGLNLFKEKSDNHYWLSHGFIYYKTIKDAKLFYVPINFLGSRYSNSGWAWRYDNYYKDFAILEIDFETEEQARIITDEFYTKYPIEGAGTGKEKLNLFDSELMSKHTSEELDKSNTNYYTVGYPVISKLDYSRYTNYSSVERRASVLHYGSPDIAVKNMANQPIRGHADSYAIDKKNKNTVTIWDGKAHYNWGYNYLLENMHMGGGASGSLVTDKDGNVLGLYRMQDTHNKLGFVEPLRSEGLYINSKIILPKYDLIKGAPGQVTSYKQQLERYYPNANTLLKSQWTKGSPNLKLVS